MNVTDVLSDLSLGSGFLVYDEKVRNAIDLIKSQQSRIEILESAITDILVAYDASAITTTLMMEAQQNLRNLVSN